MSKLVFPKSHKRLSTADKRFLDSVPDEQAQEIMDYPSTVGTVLVIKNGKATQRDFSKKDHQAAKDYFAMQKEYGIRNGISIH